MENRRTLSVRAGPNRTGPGRGPGRAGPGRPILPFGPGRAGPKNFWVRAGPGRAGHDGHPGRAGPGRKIAPPGRAGPGRPPHPSGPGRAGPEKSGPISSLIRKHIQVALYKRDFMQRSNLKLISFHVRSKPSLEAILRAILLSLQSKCPILC